MKCMHPESLNGNCQSFAFIGQWALSCLRFTSFQVLSVKTQKIQLKFNTAAFPILLTGIKCLLWEGLKCLIHCAVLHLSSLVSEQTKNRASAAMHSLPLKRFIHVWHHTVHRTSCPQALSPGFFVLCSLFPVHPRGKTFWEPTKAIRAKEEGWCALGKGSKVKRCNPVTVSSASFWENDKAPSGLSVHWISC